MPAFIRNRFIGCIDIAEKKLGKPPSYAQIHIVSWREYGNPINTGITNAIFLNLYREDLFYADKQFTVFSTNKNGPGKEGMELFSERFKRLYPGYFLDRNMRIRAKPETKVLNLNTLLKVLRSNDQKLWQESKWIFPDKDDVTRFLDGQPNKSNKIAFASFPRSGNTFLRKYTELLTGV